MGDDEVVEEIRYSYKSTAKFVCVRHYSKATAGYGVLENRVLVKGCSRGKPEGYVDCSATLVAPNSGEQRTRLVQFN
jgi:hypothetical protein